jgi:methyl coenzyme M reductase gamma subunit
MSQVVQFIGQQYGYCIIFSWKYGRQTQPPLYVVMPRWKCRMQSIQENVNPGQSQDEGQSRRFVQFTDRRSISPATK